MRITRLATAALLTALTASCRDSAPTASSPSAQSPGRATLHLAMGEAAGASVTIPPVGGFSSQVLSRGQFVDDVNVTVRLKYDRETMVSQADRSGDVIFARITFQPGGALPWHTHPGPVIVSVASGELTVVRAPSCEVYHYPAGSSFVDPGQGMVHAAFNGTGAETVLNVTYLGVPAGQSPLVPVPNPGC